MGDPEYYAKLCEDTELQNTWKPAVDDHVWDKEVEKDGHVTKYQPSKLMQSRESRLYVGGIAYQVELDGPPFERFKWLPTETQLEGLVYFDQKKFEDFLKEPYDLGSHPQGAPAKEIFGSEREYHLLAYVMKKQFSKVWVQKKWYPVDPSNEL